MQYHVTVTVNEGQVMRLYEAICLAACFSQGQDRHREHTEFSDKVILNHVTSLDPRWVSYFPDRRVMYSIDT